MTIRQPFRHRSSIVTMIVMVVGLVVGIGCDGDAGVPDAAPTGTSPATAPTAEAGPLRAVVSTPAGDFTIEFRPDIAPIACASFVNLVQRQFFDGLLFYRHSPVIRQAGNPFNDADVRWNCGYTIAPEFSPDLRFDRGGLVGLTRVTDDPSSPVRPNEFFVTTKPQSERFTFKYPAFAEIIEGQDVVLRIPEGERIDTIRLVGDPTAILAPHAGMVSVWNRMLDAAGDPRAGN